MSRRIVAEPVAEPVAEVDPESGLTGRHQLPLAKMKAGLP